MGSKVTGSHGFRISSRDEGCSQQGNLAGRPVQQAALAGGPHLCHHALEVVQAVRPHLVQDAGQQVLNLYEEEKGSTPTQSRAVCGT